MKRASIAKYGVFAATLICICDAASAQAPPGGPPPQSSRQAAVIDLSGYWVSIVNEDWRWRMLTPPKGDYASVPLNAAGRKQADIWDATQDGSCRAYGAAGLMRMPTRLHISWESDDVLKIESDSGEQTRRLFFKAAPAAGGAKTLQGRSLAAWEPTAVPAGGFGFPGRGPPPPGGSLRVTTSDLAPGWLRRNGVPYSENTTVTEYFDRFPTPDGNEWFVVTTVVDDPQYLQQPYTTSSHFRRETDGAKWHPAPCRKDGT